MAFPASNEKPANIRRWRVRECSFDIQEAVSTNFEKRVYRNLKNNSLYRRETLQAWNAETWKGKWKSTVFYVFMGIFLLFKWCNVRTVMMRRQQKMSFVYAAPQQRLWKVHLWSLQCNSFRTIFYYKLQSNHENRYNSLVHVEIHGRKISALSTFQESSYEKTTIVSAPIVSGGFLVVSSLTSGTTTQAQTL